MSVIDTHFLFKSDGFTMLQKLTIKNFALIDHLEMDFKDGFRVFQMFREFPTCFWDFQPAPRTPRMGGGKFC